jgi:hypothetical protein
VKNDRNSGKAIREPSHTKANVADDDPDKQTPDEELARRPKTQMAAVLICVGVVLPVTAAAALGTSALYGHHLDRQ